MLHHRPCCAHSATAPRLQFASGVCSIFHSAACSGTHLLQIEHGSTLCNAYAHVVCRTSCEVHTCQIRSRSLIHFPAGFRSMHFLYRVVCLHQDSKSLCGGIPSAHQATTHTTLKRFLYLSYTPREPDALHHSHFASVRPFIRLPACSVICDRVLACRRYCKKNSYLRLCFYQRVIGYCRSAS